MMRFLSVILVGLILTSCLGVCELELPSDPVNMDNVVGLYVPTHAGTETLQVRSDYVWERLYQYSDGRVEVDSGEWTLDTTDPGYYVIVLDDWCRRHPAWVRSPHLLPEELRPDGSPMKRWSCGLRIRNDNGKMLIEVESAHGMYYQKVP
ncbi:MAG: hypothetical protein ABII79_14265 [bacterium]